MIAHRETRNALRWLLAKLDVELVFPTEVELSNDPSLGPGVIGITPQGSGIQLRARMPEVLFPPGSWTAHDADCATTLMAMQTPADLPRGETPDPEHKPLEALVLEGIDRVRAATGCSVEEIYLTCAPCDLAQTRNAARWFLDPELVLPDAELPPGRIYVLPRSTRLPPT